MFFARRPSPATIDAAVARSRELQLSYSPTGIVRSEPTAYRFDQVVVPIGRGRADFERARAALVAWKQFDLGWVELFPRHAPIDVGTNVAVLIRHFGFWSLNGCRVVYSIGDGTGRAVSRPRAPLARLGFPLVRALQDRFRVDSASATARAVR